VGSPLGTGEINIGVSLFSHSEETWRDAMETARQQYQGREFHATAGKLPVAAVDPQDQQEPPEVVLHGCEGSRGQRVRPGADGSWKYSTRAIPVLSSRRSGLPLETDN